MIAASILRRARMPSSPSPLFVRSFISEACVGRAGPCQIPAFMPVDLTGAKGGDEFARRRPAGAAARALRAQGRRGRCRSLGWIISPSSRRTPKRRSPSITTFSASRPGRARRSPSPAPGSTMTARRCCMSCKDRRFRTAAACSTISLSWARTPSAYVAKLKERGIKYDLRRLPQPGHAGGLMAIVLLRSQRRAGGDRLCGERDRGGGGLASRLRPGERRRRVSKDGPFGRQPATPAGSFFEAATRRLRMRVSDQWVTSRSRACH